MLSSLSLSNVALIKKQTINFKRGFNCLLGQSGAGKSIVIDALSFVLGAKADKGLIRTGENLMRVDAVFSDLSDDVLKFLQEQDIEVENELIVTRTLSVEGKSSIKINGFPATAKSLQELSLLLADFCGQHDSVGLLNVNNHLLLLDKFAGQEVEDLKELVSVEYDKLKDLEKQISECGGSDEVRERTKDLLSYQIQEIEKAQLKSGEWEELKERFDFISSSESIFEKVSEALGKLDEQRENAGVLLYEAKSVLSSLSNFKDIEECKERIENCYYEIKDVAETLEQIKQNADYDPKELERIDSRIDLIKGLSKKYGNTVDDILQFSENCKQKLEDLENSQFILEKLNKQKIETQQKLEDLCKKLSDKRKEFAKMLEVRLTEELECLEMKGTFFKVDFEKIDCSKKGFDSVKFKFSANKGQEIKDLHKTASGGELSRLLLSFKNVLLDKEKVQTVVFDEIDSGISGLVAGRLADKLANISKFVQVVCITHTPVVAARADAFLLVEKQVVDDSTISTICELDDDQAVVEIARLIDNSREASQTAIQHAKKLLQ